MSRYLSIARTAVSGYEINEENEKSPAPVCAPPEERYERNELDERSPAAMSAHEAKSLGLDPALRWVRVYTGPVEATKPPDGWDGSLPDGCGWPNLCQKLGPCPRHLSGGPCRIDRSES